MRIRVVTSVHVSGLRATDLDVTESWRGERVRRMNEGTGGKSGHCEYAGQRGNRMRMPFTARCAVRRSLLGLLLLACMMLAVTPTVASAHGGTGLGAWYADVRGPIAGPPGALSATTFDLSAVGYQQDELFLSGTAAAYAPAPGTAVPLPSDGRWQIAESGFNLPYTTRLVVHRPADPAAFSGTVFVEWLNVSNQSDSAPDWLMGHVELVRAGHAWVGVSAQALGVEAAKAADPGRYGELSHPGDSFSYDIFTEAGAIVRDDAATLLGGLRPAHVIAVGESQSASRLVTYINAVHPIETAFDGFLVHSRGRAGAPLSQDPLPSVPTTPPTHIRDDLDVPVFVLQAEDDVLRGGADVRQVDTAHFRLWEMAGTSHADNYTLGIGQVDVGDGSAEHAMFARMRDPSADPLPVLPPCPAPVNAGPHTWILRAAMHHVDRWVSEGTAPPRAAPIALTGVATAPYLDTAVTDALGNAVGGVRSPQLDAPVAVLRGVGNEGGQGFCRLFGTTVPLEEQTLVELYGNHGGFVSEWSQAARRAVDAGFLLEADAEHLIAAAARSDVARS
jgi:hypothetical protein